MLLSVQICAVCPLGCVGGAGKRMWGDTGRGLGSALLEGQCSVIAVVIALRPFQGTAQCVLGKSLGIISMLGISKTGKV